MAVATRYRPGIHGTSPAVALGAAGVIALMGFYGFATSVQKAAAVRDTGALLTAAADNSRAATPVVATPAMLYALTDRPPAPIAIAAPARSRLPEPVIDSEPTPVNLVSAPAPEGSPIAVAATAPELTTPSAAVGAVDASATEAGLRP